MSLGVPLHWGALRHSSNAAQVQCTGRSCASLAVLHDWSLLTSGKLPQGLVYSAYGGAQ